jgi:hypothetical protein
MERSHAAAVPPDVIESKRVWHRVQAALPIREKLRILLELQRQDLPLLAKQSSRRRFLGQ